MVKTTLSARTRTAALLTAAALLGGCAGTSAFDQLDTVAPTGTAFQQSLFKNYSYLAKSFGVNRPTGDVSWYDPTSYFADSSATSAATDSDAAKVAEIYADKALVVAQGTDVQPEAGQTADQQAARERLMSALVASSASAPVTAARAQAAFDCWVLDGAVTSLAASAAQCRRAFNSSLASLEHGSVPISPMATSAPPALPSAFTVYFEFDSWTLTAEDLSVLQQAIAAARTGRQTRISIVGHTDTSGTVAYNQSLSVKRANVVKEALVDLGARATAIESSGVGKTDLAIQTADGIKEPRNRRGVISLLP
jgi:OOP family OmpA-OmpF porin